MSLQHEPDQGFVRDLEWQLVSELRRRNRFQPKEPRAGLSRSLRMAALITLCAVVGVAAAKTVEHFENAKEQTLLIARMETAVEILEARQRIVHGLAAVAKEKVDAGLYHPDELAQARHQSNLLDAELDRARLDLKEVQLTGRPPANELSAPLQDGRDFVDERLRGELSVISEIESFVRARLEEIKTLEEAGLVHQSETEQMAAQLDSVITEGDVIRLRRDLRAAFLAGYLTVEQLEWRKQHSEAKSRLGRCEMAEREAEANFRRVSRAYENGMATELELDQAELRLVTAKAEHRLTKAEFELLEDKLQE